MTAGPPFVTPPSSATPPSSSAAPSAAPPSSAGWAGGVVDARTVKDPAGRAEPGRAVRTRRFRWAVALLALATLACTAACAGPPSKGPVHSAPLNQSRNNVVILANEPNSGMSPSTLITSFLQALTGDQEDPGFSVAQEFLAPEVRAKWIPAGSTWSVKTKIVDYSSPVPVDQHATDHPAHPADAPAAGTAPQAAEQTPVGTEETFSVGGQEKAQIDPYGFFQYRTESVTQLFTVKYLGPSIGWRITTPPDFRMVRPEAFKRAYQTYQSPLAVYLPLRGAVNPVMDQVYLTQDSGKVDYTYDALARAVLHGRSQSQDTHLALAGPVTVDSTGTARVILQPPSAGQADLIGDVQQAMLKTFQDASENPQLLSSTALTQVLVDYAGCTSCQSVPVAPNNSAPPPVYWVCPQSQGDSNAAIVSLSPQVLPAQPPGTPTAPAVCTISSKKVTPVVPTTGLQLQKDSPIAVKQAPDSANQKQSASTTIVAAVQTDGSVVVVDDKNAGHNVWYTATAGDPKNITDLEWDPVDGSLWVVDNNTLYRVQDPGPKGSTTGSPQAVLVPDQHVLRFKPSPDGQRAVVVSGLPTSDPTAAASSQPASMVFITRSGDSATLSNAEGDFSGEFPLLQGETQTGDKSSIGLQAVTDAAWADGRTVLLLGLQQAESSTPKLYKVYLDGSQDSTISTPEDAQSTARHITAVAGVSTGHQTLWTMSDASGPTDPNTTYSYFRRSNGSDSFQELGWSPVAATATAG